MARWNITLYGANSMPSLTTYNETLKTSVTALSGVVSVVENIIWLGETYERGEGYEAVGNILVNSGSVRRIFGRVESDIYSLYEFDNTDQRANYLTLLQKRFIFLWTDDFLYLPQQNASPQNYCIPVAITEFSIIESSNQKQFSYKLAKMYNE